MLLIHPPPNKVVLVTCGCFVLFHIAIDFFLFDLKTIQGHGYVFLMEVLLQVTIYSIVPQTKAIRFDGLNRQWLASVWLINTITLVYKLLFVGIVARASYASDFADVFPFAVGSLYRVPQIADGYIDLIANALYQCGFCLGGHKVPLNEPFIAYVFIAISKLSGEFNHHSLWLTLHCANVLAALVLLKIAQNFLPTIRFLWAVPFSYLLVLEVHGISLLLFKDGLIVLVTLLLLYINYRQISGNGWGQLAFVAASVPLIVFLYNLRTGTLVAILSISIMNVIFNPKSWRRHISVLLLGVSCITMLGNVDGFSNKLQQSLSRATDKAMHGSSKHLDVDSLSYTTTRENSIFHKFKLHDVTPTNFFYAPFVKASLYYLLPLPVNKIASLPDLFHKLSTLLYSSLFSIFLIGLYKVAKGRLKNEWYLVAFLGIFVALFLGAGPMLVPRYRVMTSALFLLVVAVAASRISNRFIALNIGISGGLVIALTLFWYDPLYKMLQSFV